MTFATSKRMPPKARGVFRGNANAIKPRDKYPIQPTLTVVALGMSDGTVVRHRRRATHAA
jgi:hypothetical protein